MQASHPPSARAGVPSVPYRIVRAMLVVVFFWVFWKFGGYIVTVLVVRQFGSGATTDAYFFATQAVVYGLVFAPVMSVLVPAFIPVFTEERARRGEEAAWAFARSVLLVVLLACAALLALAYACAGPVTDMLVRGFDAEARALGVRMLQWLMPGAVLMVVFLLLRSLLHSYKVFGYPAAAEAAQKLLWVAVLVAAAAWLGVQAAVVGFVVGSVVMVALGALGLRGRLSGLWRGAGAMSSGRFAREALVALAFLLGTGGALWAASALLPQGLSRYRDLVLITLVLAAVLLYALLLWRRSRRRSGAMARFAVLAVPLTIGSFFACYRGVVTVYFQSFTRPGVFSDIEAARKVVNFPVDLVALALAVAMLPYLCELASRRDRALLGDILTKALRMLAVGFVPLTVMTLILADPVCRLVFDRGDRAAQHLHHTALALQMLSLALVVYAAERVIMQGYFSLQRMWAPVLMGIGAACVQVAFMAVPIYAWGMDDPVQVFVLVALSYPVSRLIKNAALLLMLKARVPVMPLGQSLRFAVKLAFLSVAVAAAVWGSLFWIRRALPYEQYRERKVVVANFEVDARALSAPRATALDVRPVPGLPNVFGAAMTYRRGEMPPALTLHADGLSGAGPGRLSFVLGFEKAVKGLRVEVVDRTGRPGRLDYAIARDGEGALWSGVMGVGDAGVALVRWAERGGPATGETNTMYLQEVRLEGFGEQAAAGRLSYWNWGKDVAVEEVNLAGGGRQPGYALVLPPGQEGLELDCSPPFALAGDQKLRCRLMNGSDRVAQVELRLCTPASRTHAVTLSPGTWQTVELGREQLGLQPEDWRWLRLVGLRAGGDQGPVYMDDLTLRTEARLAGYMLVMLLHCGVPTIVGLAFMLALLKVLHFPELGYVVRWVKERGWRRRAGEGGPADGPP